MNTEDRIAALESLILHANPRDMSVPTMDALLRTLLSRAAAVGAEAKRTFKPWTVDDLGGRRCAVDGKASALVRWRDNQWELTVVQPTGFLGPMRVPLALAMSIDEALTMANTVLAIAGWRLE